MNTIIRRNPGENLPVNITPPINTTPPVLPTQTLEPNLPYNHNQMVQPYLPYGHNQMVQPYFPGRSITLGQMVQPNYPYGHNQMVQPNYPGQNIQPNYYNQFGTYAQRNLPNLSNQYNNSIFYTQNTQP